MWTDLLKTRRRTGDPGTSRLVRGKWPPSDLVQNEPDLPPYSGRGFGALPQGGRLVGTLHMSSPDLSLLAATVCEIDISVWPPSVSSPATLNTVLQNCRKPAQEPWAYSCAGDCARLAQGVRGGFDLIDEK